MTAATNNVRDDRIGVIITDADNRVIEVDDTYAQIVGRSRRDLLGRYALSFTYRDDLPRNRPLLDDLSRSGRGFAITKRYVRGDGSLVWVHNHVSRIRQPSGEHLVAVTCRPIGRPVDAGLERNHRLARQFCAALQAMKRDLSADIVSAPAAEALVWLYRAEIEGIAMRVDEVARAVACAVPVVVRWIRLLEERGLVEPEGDDRFAPSTIVRISGAGERALDGLFSTFAS